MAEHQLKIKAVLDTSDIQSKLNQLNNSRNGNSGSSGGSQSNNHQNLGNGISSALNSLNRNIVNLSKAISQLTKTQVINGRGRSLSTFPMGIPDRNRERTETPLIPYIPSVKSSQDHARNRGRGSIPLDALRDDRPWTHQGTFDLEQISLPKKMMTKDNFNKLIPFFNSPFNGGVYNFGKSLQNKFGFTSIYNIGRFGRGLREFARSGLSDAFSLSPEIKRMGGKYLASEGFGMLADNADSARSAQSSIGNIGSGVASGLMLGGPWGAVAGGLLGATQWVVKIGKESEDALAEVEGLFKKVADEWSSMRKQIDNLKTSRYYRKETEWMDFITKGGATEWVLDEKNSYSEKLEGYKTERDKLEDFIIHNRNGATGDRLYDVQKAMEKLEKVNADIQFAESMIAKADEHIENKRLERIKKEQDLENEKKRNAEETARMNEGIYAIMKRRESMVNGIDDIRFAEDIFMKNGESAISARTASYTELLDMLSNIDSESNTVMSRRKQAYLMMQHGAEMLDQNEYDKGKRLFDNESANIDSIRTRRSTIANEIQSIFQEMMSYMGLSGSDFGSLASLGGFGSSSLMSDPLLDVNREMNRTLGNILREIQNKDVTARYL